MLNRRMTTSVTAVAGSSTSVVVTNVARTMTVDVTASPRIQGFAPVSAHSPSARNKPSWS